MFFFAVVSCLVKSIEHLAEAFLTFSHDFHDHVLVAKVEHNKEKNKYAGSDNKRDNGKSCKRGILMYGALFVCVSCG